MPPIAAPYGGAPAQGAAIFATGVVRSVFDLVGAILRSAAGGVAGLMTGVLDGT